MIRSVRGATAILVAGMALAACSDAAIVPSTTPASSPTAAVTVDPTPRPTPLPTLLPTPTPDPTPRFTNEPDAELAGSIPSSVAGLEVVVPAVDQFGLTPGDVGLAYGDIGLRFASLAIAYIEQPRVLVYAMRVEGQDVSTTDLEPHLPAAGRYVGIAGLDSEPWEPADVGGSQVWVRPGDSATGPATRIYTWSSGEMVFLLIGVDDGVNRTLIAALPGEPSAAGTPTPSAGDAQPGASGSDG